MFRSDLFLEKEVSRGHLNPPVANIETRTHLGRSSMQGRSSPRPSVDLDSCNRSNSWNPQPALHGSVANTAFQNVANSRMTRTRHFFTSGKASAYAATTVQSCACGRNRDCTDGGGLWVEL